MPPPKRQAPKPILPMSQGSRAGVRARLDDNDENAMVVAVTAKEEVGASAVAAVGDSRDSVLSELSLRVEELSGAFVRLANRGDSGSLRAAADAETAALREQIKGETVAAAAKNALRMSSKNLPRYSHFSLTYLTYNSAQGSLISTLHAEVARLESRLVSEGGPARLPPASIRASSLYLDAVARADAAEAASAQASARASSAEAAAASLKRAVEENSARAAQGGPSFAAMRALTGIDIQANDGAIVGADGAPRGVYTCRMGGPSGELISFSLDFFMGETDDERETPMVEFTPGAGAEFLPEYLHSVISFDTRDAPAFFGRVIDALRNGRSQASATKEATAPSPAATLLRESLRSSLDAMVLAGATPHAVRRAASSLGSSSRPITETPLNGGTHAPQPSAVKY